MTGPPGGFRPTWTEVDLDVLESNARAAVRRAGPERRVLAVVKADGYGHGAVPSCRAFAAAGAWGFAVALLEEALELRRGGVGGPVVVLGPLLPSQLAPALDAGAAVSVYSPEVAEALLAEGLRREAPVGYHLKVDTGMGRLGILARDVGPLARRLAAAPGLRMEGLFTQLACADDPDAALTARQVESFRAALEAVRAAGHAPEHVHAANSAADLRGFPEFCNVVRPGLALYGYSPRPDQIADTGLSPALAVRSRIAQLKPLAPGDTVGYGATWKAPRAGLLATVPIGYEDGYPSALSNRAQMLARGRRAPVVGRVSMDLTTVDVTDVPGVAVGDTLTVLGRDGDDAIDAWELARWAGTISWEILVSIGRRVPRLLLRGGEVVETRAALPGPGGVIA